MATDLADPLGAEQRGLLLRPPDEHHPLRRGEVLQVLVHHVVLALPLAEVHPRDALGLREPAHRPSEPVGDLRQRCGRRYRQTQLAVHVPDQTGGVLQPRLIERFKYMRSMHSTSKTTCSARTSATVRATVMTGSGSGSGGHHCHMAVIY